MKIQSLTVQHDPAEDRIVLLVRLGDAEQILLLTRRLTCGLLNALSKQIEHTQGDQRLAQSGLQDELLSMKHNGALNRVRDTQPVRPDVSAAPKRLPTRLLTQIEVSTQDNGRHLVFSDANGDVASVAFDAAQLHWFVGRLATHSRNAGWGNPIPVPGWLEPNTIAEPAPQQAGRSLH